MSPKFIALIPWRGTLGSKSRLAVSLGSSRAFLLAEKVLRHVFRICKESGVFDGIYLITRGSVPPHLHANVIFDNAEGLDSAVELGVQTVRAVGSCNVMVIMGDLLNLRVDHLHRTAEALRKQDFAIVPSQDKGTSILAFTESVTARTVYGRESSLRTTERMIEAGYAGEVLDFKVHDMDTLEDILMAAIFESPSDQTAVDNDETDQDRRSRHLVEAITRTHLLTSMQTEYPSK